MRVTAFMEHASLDLELEFEDGIIMNGGAGEFSIAVIGVKQYSKPRIKPTGTLVLNGKTYPMHGLTVSGKKSPPKRAKPEKVRMTL